MESLKNDSIAPMTYFDCPFLSTFSTGACLRTWRFNPRLTQSTSPPALHRLSFELPSMDGTEGLEVQSEVDPVDRSTSSPLLSLELL
ncbi:hypothetical protein BDV25DRAFT_165265, partial [Aspergillus avenaceus]